MCNFGLAILLKSNTYISNQNIIVIIIKHVISIHVNQCTQKFQTIKYK